MNKRSAIAACLLGALCCHWPAGLAWGSVYNKRIPFRITVYRKVPESVMKNPVGALRTLPTEWSRRVTVAQGETGAAVKIEEAGKPPLFEWVVEKIEKVAQLDGDGHTVTFDGIPEEGEVATAWSFEELQWLRDGDEGQVIQYRGVECLLFRESEPGGAFAIVARKTKYPVVAGSGGTLYFYEFPYKLEGLAMPDLVKARVEESTRYLQKLKTRGRMPALR